ncbi:AAA family ATPase, partial [Caballeronia sp.]|uniref:AAA family ATPase n=1 Tax=Caballeronia sp. TaxID=1931223 RepID=UPI003C5A3C52
MLEPLREEADFTLYRGRELGKQTPVLALAVAAEGPSPQSLRRLEHEWSLESKLDAAWAAQPVALTRHLRRAVLILKDPGGEPLDRLIEQRKDHPLDLPHFLRIAIGLTSALSQAHQQGLIHKDVKPANALVDHAGHVWLTGFGIASRLPHERQEPEAPEYIAGSLPYMAPEQTGRMNRSIDSRSDLYSLGVTLYQMLTGSLPFTAVDPMDWVHCHIARKPVPPGERAADVPPVISAIVVKLLAKTAEDRYQTAAGLERDLRRCLADWERGSLADFPLAEDDTPDRFLIPEKLYGRDREVEALLASFDRMIKIGAPELVLVSGYSGVGKSSVVNELHKVLVPPRGLFASGKFDQRKRDIPYATVAQAFQSLVRQVLGKSETELHIWREALREALGPNGPLIVSLIPELELVIGAQPPVLELPPQDAQRRFQTVLLRFIAVFARPEHPLALFLDDLQWLDAATLDLLEDILAQRDIRHLLLIGAYRDNEIDATHPLMRKLDAIRQAGATVHDIVLAPLTYDDLGQLISDSLRCEATRANPLVQLVQEKTGGNPFFATQFLHALADESLLAFDHTDARWSWDLGRIYAKRYTDNVVDLMVAKLNRLPAATLAALRQLACVGFRADFALLATVCQTSPGELHDSLWEAVRAGLVFRSETSYAFQHDRIQEAAYSLIPEAARAEIHLQIGRSLLADTPPDNREEIVFEIVSQFNRSATLITAQEERTQVAWLNLMAGKRARNATAYSSALTYFAEGRALLADDCWAQQYPLVFELELHRAEAEFLTGEMPSAEERLSILARRATNRVDQAAVACMHMDLYNVLSRLDRAVAVCLDYLQGVGVDWSAQPTDEDVQQEYERVWRRLGTRQIEDLIDLPLLNDADTRATLDVLTKAMVSSQSTDSNLFRLMVARMVNLSLNHGNSDASSCAYVWFGWVFSSDFADYPTALRFGQLGIDLVNKRGLDAFKVRVYLPFAIWISPRQQSVRSCRALILQTSDEANSTGDLAYTGYCHVNLIINSCFSGTPLGDLDREVMVGIEFAQKTNSVLIAAIVLSFLFLVRTLRGLPNDFVNLGDKQFDEDALVRCLEAEPNLLLAAGSYWIRRLETCVFAGDYAEAVAAALKAKGWLDLLSLAPTFIDLAEYHFYAAMARAGAIDAGAASPSEGQSDLEALTAHHQQLQTWAEHCPENVGDRAALVGAEIARLEGRDLDAERLYQQAIRSARKNGFIHNEALACETAARFYAVCGFEDIAEMYLLRAREGYRRWGADGVVRQLEARYPQLATAEPRGTAKEAIDQQLDVAAVVKASQALSSEMLLPHLIERLMTIALQNAGAERGLLILIRDGEPRIEAEAATGQGKIEVAARHAAITPSDLPQSVLHYAIRTRERVLLDDASADHVYLEDEYVRQSRSKSVLCLPIVKQAKLVGALYLENNLVPFAFTPDRVAVLQLLASQAAISLENAHLYADLQLQAGLLQRLPVSAWTLKPDGTPDFVNQVWLDYSGQTLDFVRSHPEAWMTGV